MSDAAIAALTKQVQDLEADRTKLRGEAKDRRVKNRELQTQLDAALADKTKLTTRVTELETQAKSGPKELTDKIASLEGQLRVRDHRDAFSTALGDFKVTKKDQAGKDVQTKFMLAPKATVDTLMREIGYKAEGDVPDGAKLSTLLGSAVESHPYLFTAADAATPAASGTGPIVVPPSQRGPGGGKGDSNPPNRAKTAADVVNQRFAKFGGGRGDGQL